MCDCGCNTCDSKRPVVLNESVAPKEILSEGLKYHLDNARPLTEHVYRAGSDSYFNLWAEARALYSRNIIEVQGDDLEVITETDLGHFGLYEDKKVPLDFVFEENIHESIIKDINTWGHLYESINIKDHYKIEDIDQSWLDVKFIFTDKHNIKRALGILDNQIKLYWFDPKKNDWSLGEPLSKHFDEKVINTHGYLIVNHILPKWENIWFKPVNDVRYRMFRALLFNNLDQSKYDLDYDDNTFTIEITSKSTPLNEAEKKKTPALNKPKRGGSKKFYVYVRNPKTKKIKKVSFGDTSGLSAKINNPEARRAFAKRHDCANKKDKTKASYWSCRLPRYAKLLGLKSNFSGFW